MTERSQVLDQVREVIRIEAEAAARNYGIALEPVIRVFDRLTRHHFGDPLPDQIVDDADVDDLNDNVGQHDLVSAVPELLRRPTLLDRALQYLPVDEAVTCCEVEDLGALDSRVALVDYLSDDQTALYSLDELEQLLVACVSQLERNRPHLVQTGYPASSISTSSWLHTQLALLYPVKLPLEISSTGGDSEEALYSYVWPRTPAPSWGIEFHVGPVQFTFCGRGVWRRDWYGPGGQVRNDDGEPVTACLYKDAALIDGLSAADAARLEAGRERLLDLKIRVLAHLAGALRARAAERVWPGALGILVEAITADDAEFYLCLDQFFAGSDFRSGRIADEPSVLPCGGLASLLELVGHCEQELTIGTIARTAGRLQALRLDHPVESYFQVVGQPCRADFDALLDGLLRLDARASDFWQEYRARVNHALAEEFYEEVVVRTRVRRKFAALFEPQIRSFADFQRAHLEATGAFPLLGLGLASAAPTPNNVFRRDGQVWKVTFQGKTESIPDRVGLHYIAALIRRPSRAFSPIELVRTARGTPTDGSPPVPAAAVGQLVASGLRVTGLGDAGEILTPETMTNYRQDVDARIAERDEAERNDDFELVARLQAHIDAVLRELGAATGRGNRPKKASSASEKARKAVGNSLANSLKLLESAHPVLWAHLKASIKTRDGVISYEPAEPIEWVLEPRTT
jgi:hypothetical protein